MSYVTAPSFPMDVLSQCTLSGQLRVSLGRYCYNCGLPLGYFGDRRGVCGRRTFFVARQRVLIRTSMFSYARRSRLENIVCNFPDVLDTVLEFIHRWFVFCVNEIENSVLAVATVTIATWN